MRFPASLALEVAYMRRSVNLGLIGVVGAFALGQTSKMIVVAKSSMEAFFGAYLAKKRIGTRPDIAQHAGSSAILLCLIGVLATILTAGPNRSMGRTLAIGALSMFAIVVTKAVTLLQLFEYCWPNAVTQNRVLRFISTSYFD